MEVKVDTSQIAILEDFFQGLSLFDQRKIFLGGFRKAAKPLIIAAQANAPNDRGNLRRSIGTVEVPQEIAILVGSKTNTPYTTKSGRGSKVWYGQLLEVGSYKVGERHWKRGSKKSTGVLKATHFFEDAYNVTQEQIYNTIEQEWYNEIDRYIVKTNNKLK